MRNRISQDNCEFGVDLVYLTIYYVTRNVLFLLQLEFIARSLQLHINGGKGIT